MTKQSVKDMENDISLKNLEIHKLTASYKSLATKYQELETQYKQLQYRNPTVFKCTLCENNFASKNDLKAHSKNKHAGSLKCDVCGKVFDEEWKCNAHIKSHNIFPCDNCEKVFNQEGTRSRHKTAVHEQIRIYCHFYNNNKNCPFESQCIFLHEDSQECKYGKICERVNCMYKHVNDENDVEGEEEMIEDDETENDTEEINMTANETFLNPSQEKIELLKCDKCEFQSEENYIIQNHTASHHQLYCCRCKQDFVSKTQCRKHRQKVHNINPF